MKAWIENNIIRDIAHSEPNDIYHPEVAVFYNTEVPDDAVNGDGWVNNTLIKRPPPPEPVPPPRTWSLDGIRSKLTLTEKVKWDNDSVPEVKTAKLELAQPQELSITTEILQMLVTASVISEATETRILE